MPVTIICGPKASAWGGDLILSREFFNPATRQYVHIEAHEVRGQPEFRPDGTFAVAFWTEKGNEAPGGFDGDLRHVVARVQACAPPEGFLEMDIPDEWYT